jgi:hypothetical protein
MGKYGLPSLLGASNDDTAWLGWHFNPISHPQMPIQRPVLNRFAEVLGGDVRGGISQRHRVGFAIQESGLINPDYEKEHAPPLCDHSTE